MGNPFFGTPFFVTKRSIFFCSNCIGHYQKTAFIFDPRPWEVPEPENTQIHVLAYFMCFLVRALPEVRDQIRKQFFL